MTELLLIPVIGILILVGFFLLILGIRKKNKLWLGYGCVCVFLGIICSFGFMKSEFMAVDRCLDSGGSYNYESQVCEHE